MALDDDARKAAELVARKFPKEVRAKHDKRAFETLKNFLFNETDVDYSDIGAVVDHAYELAVAAGTGKPGEESESEKGKAVKGGKSTYRRRGKIDESLITAPFRFIEIPDVVLAPESEEPIGMDVPVPDGYCGAVELEWTAETPLLIGAPGTARERDGTGNAPVEPLQVNGGYVVPGATVRGLTRANAEICGLAKLTQFNGHHRYGVRDFDHPYYTEDTGISQVEKVHAGFLSIRPVTADTTDEDRSLAAADGRIWRIRPAESWAHVPIEALSEIGINTQRPGRNNREWKEQTLADKYEIVGMVSNRAINFGRKQRFVRTSTIRDDGREVSPAKQGGKEGVFVFSGRLPGGGNKKFEYAVFDNPSARPFAIPADVVETFRRLYSTPNKNRLDPVGSWKDLAPVAEKAEVPVFYIGDPAQPQNFFFGLTRLFKMPHRTTPGDVLLDSQPAHAPQWQQKRNSETYGYQPDFVEKLFGYVVEPADFLPVDRVNSADPTTIARKSRVAFSMATLDAATPAKEAAAVTLVQMGPRASFSPFYLRGNGEKDYSGGKVALAGRKAYFPRYTAPDSRKALSDMRAIGERQVEAIKQSSPSKTVSQETLSHLKFLVPAADKPLRFRSTIRFHNVTAAEIGLVLFALTHGGSERHRHMVGRAKPFGAGQMQIRVTTLAMTRNDGKTEDATQQDFMDAFMQHARRVAPNYPRIAAVEEWLGMADPAQGERAAANGTLDYQPLKSFGQMRKYVKPMTPPSDPPMARDRLLPAPRSTGDKTR